MKELSEKSYLQPLIAQVKQYLKKNKKLYNFRKQLINYSIDINAFESQLLQVKYNDGQDYSRIKIYESEEFEMILFYWPSGYESKIHSHPSKGCLLNVLGGELTELRFQIAKQPLEYLSELPLKTDNVYYIDDSLGYYHKICNRTQHPAISFHIYAPGGQAPENFIIE